MQAAPLSGSTRPRPPERLDLIFQEHHDSVFRAAYRITGNAADAEDVLQTVFLRLLRRERGELLSGDPGPYLRLAAVNGALDVVRARSVRKDLPVGEDTAAGRGGDDRAGGGHARGRHVVLEDDGLDPERRSSDRELMEMLRAAIGRLSRPAAQAFVLRHIEGYGNDEIARMLGTSRSVVAVTLHRARGRLRGEVQGWLKGEKR